VRVSALCHLGRGPDLDFNASRLRQVIPRVVRTSSLVTAVEEAPANNSVVPMPEKAAVDGRGYFVDFTLSDSEPRSFHVTLNDAFGSATVQLARPRGQHLDRYQLELANQSVWKSIQIKLLEVGTAKVKVSIMKYAEGN